MRSTAAPPALRVSIHAFRGEGDKRGGVDVKCERVVSIHAFRGEGDLQRRANRAVHRRFNPRLPGGRRPKCTNTTTSKRRFNPRLPGGRRRGRAQRPANVLPFQSTPSGGKATQRVDVFDARRAGFNPRLPGGRRRALPATTAARSSFQSTPSGGKATAISRAAVPCSRQIL